jgi:hypothetical protein
MKTKQKMISKMLLFVSLMCMSSIALCQEPAKPLAAVLGVESKGVIQDAETVGYILHLEMEKVNVYTIMDKYDVTELLKKNNIDGKNCMGKSCVVNAGKALHTDKIISGSVERFGDKIVILLKVIDVKTESVEKQHVIEFLNLQPELQKMIEVSVKRLLGITPDPNIENLLIYYEVPIDSPKTRISLDGPRMGGTAFIGDAAKVLTTEESKGGFNMYPVMFNFGWQKEWQYLSSGNFQALIEVVGFIGGLESGKFIPSVTFLNGFRFGTGGWEFGFGPSFRIIKKASGFWGDDNNGTVRDQWYLSSWWKENKGLTPNPYPVTSRLDSRGTDRLSTSLIIAVGKTFKSGYLNIPVNLYISPRMEGTMYGFSFGFNISQKPKTY